VRQPSEGYRPGVSDVVTDEQGRPRPPQQSGEVDTLLGFLESQRATLDWKCRGLSEEQLRVALHPSAITLGGLLKHLAYVEGYWFTEVVASQPTPEPWASAPASVDPDWEWTSAGDDSADALHALWSERAERSRRVVRDRLTSGPQQALDDSHSAWDGQGRVSLRWVLVHMIEEYARHNGHADLIRESIDGQTGE
jgi:uncharacterized damage-inducible protein DinB